VTIGVVDSAGSTAQKVFRLEVGVVAGAAIPAVAGPGIVSLLVLLLVSGALALRRRMG